MCANISMILMYSPRLTYEIVTALFLERSAGGQKGKEGPFEGGEIGNHVMRTALLRMEKKSPI